MECWNAIHFISDPICVRCGVPLEYAPGGMQQCTECLRHPPAFTAALAAMRYDKTSKNLILKLKYQDETSLAKTFGTWLRRTAGPVLPQVDYIIPVPLHYYRFLGRRYNQAALLAGALARASDTPWLPDALHRIRPTQRQTALKGIARRRNVEGAFAVHPRHAEPLRGKTVLLVDDVFTTGATLNECTKALHQAGVRDVFVVTLARRVRLEI